MNFLSSPPTVLWVSGRGTLVYKFLYFLEPISVPISSGYSINVGLNNVTNGRKQPTKFQWMHSFFEFLIEPWPVSLRCEHSVNTGLYALSSVTLWIALVVSCLLEGSTLEFCQFSERLSGLLPMLWLPFQFPVRTWFQDSCLSSVSQSLLWISLDQQK